MHSDTLSFSSLKETLTLFLLGWMMCSPLRSFPGQFRSPFRAPYSTLALYPHLQLLLYLNTLIHCLLSSGLHLSKCQCVCVQVYFILLGWDLSSVRRATTGLLLQNSLWYVVGCAHTRHTSKSHDFLMCSNVQCPPIFPYLSFSYHLGKFTSFSSKQEYLWLLWPELENDRSLGEGE